MSASAAPGPLPEPPALAESPAPSAWLADLADAPPAVPSLSTLPTELLDLVIVGAGAGEPLRACLSECYDWATGMTGCALAHLLHKAGNRSLVLDARGLAGGATGRNGGILWPQTDLELRITAKLLAFLREQEVDVDLCQKGGVSLSSPRQLVHEEPTPTTTNTTTTTSAAPATTTTSKPGQTAFAGTIDPETELHAAPGAFGGGFLYPSVASFFPAKVVRALARASTPSASFAFGCRVTEVVAMAPQGEAAGGKGPTPGHVVVRTSRGDVRARRVVLATNGWLPRLAPELQPFFRTCTNTVLCSDGPVPNDLRWNVAAVTAGEASSEVYVSQRADGRLVMGGLRGHGARPWDDPDDGPAGEDRVAALLRSWFEKRFPAMSAGLRFGRAWKGVLGFPRDGRPVQGVLPGRDGRVLVCGGYGGHGMTCSLGLAEVVAQTLCGEPIAEPDYATQTDVGRWFPPPN